MKLEKLLSNIYPVEEVNHLHDLIQRYNLSSVLQVAIDKIDHFTGVKGTDQENRITTNIGILASSFLSGVNSKLTSVPISDEKKKIELVISDIAFELIKNILDDFSGDRKLLLNAIYESVKITCEFNDYDFSMIEQLIPFQKYIALQPHSNNAKLDLVSHHFYYNWNSNKYNLNDLCQTLKSKNVIKRVKDFHMLFESPKEKFTICFNKAYHDELIVLFDVLYAQKHIAPIGTKGHFVPLRYYAVDFENQSLIKKLPKTIKYTLRKNKPKWLDINKRVGKWIANFK